MAWIYDISKTRVVNSNQLISAYFEVKPIFRINVIAAAGNGEGEYGGYGGPITFTLYEKSFEKFIDAKVEGMKSDRIKKLQAAIHENEEKLKIEMKNESDKINLKIPELRAEINALKDEESALCKLDSDEIKKIKRDPQISSDTSALAILIFNKFLENLCNPEFDKCKEPIDFAKIL